MVQERRKRSASASVQVGPELPECTHDSEGTSGAVAEPTLALEVLLDPRAREAARRPARTGWRSILAGASPREVLARLMSGDPLELRALCARVLEERRCLLDVDRVFLAGVARVARFALRYRGQPELETWLREQVDEALLELVRGDAEARDAHPGPSAASDLARPLGLDPTRVHAACTAFNQQPLDDRRAFWALLIERRSLDEVAASTNTSATEVARAARRALEATLAAHDAQDERR